jgi:hypothetical protein
MIETILQLHVDRVRPAIAQQKYELHGARFSRTLFGCEISLSTIHSSRSLSVTPQCLIMSIDQRRSLATIHSTIGLAISMLNVNKCAATVAAGSSFTLRPAA